MAPALVPRLPADWLRFVQAVGDDIVVVTTSHLGEFRMFVASIWRRDGTPDHYSFLRLETAPPLRFTVPVRPGVPFTFDEAAHNLGRLAGVEAFQILHDITAKRLLALPPPPPREERRPFEVIDGGKP